MAGTTTKSKQTQKPDADVGQLVIQYNKLVDDVEILRAGLDSLTDQYNLALAKLDADAGVTDTNYAATVGSSLGTTYDTASDMTAAKIGNPAGAAFSTSNY